MNIDEIQKIIIENDAVMIYFSGEQCSVCKALMPKVKLAFTTHFPKIKQLYINASDFPHIAAYFSVFTVPSLLIYFDGKETKRESRHISVDQLIQSNQRHYKMFFE